MILNIFSPQGLSKSNSFCAGLDNSLVLSSTKIYFIVNFFIINTYIPNVVLPGTSTDGIEPNLNVAVCSK